VSPVESVSVVQVPRKYPHIEEIGDFPTAQSIRLLWDRLFSLQEQLTAAQTTITRLVTAANLTESTATTALQKAKTALTLTQEPGAAATSSTDGGDGGGAGGGASSDGGAAGVGCAAAGSTGHDTGGVLSATRAGQITCGTGNEFSALKNPTASLAARDANQEELLERMIWHLHQAGFEAGRQQNPSGVISKDKLCIVVDSVLRAYDVFPGAAYTAPLTTQMIEVHPPHLVTTAGTPD